MGEPRTPTTDYAWPAGALDAPDGLEAVRVTLALKLTPCGGEAGYVATDDDGREHGPMHRTAGDCDAWIERKAPERTVVYWVGLDEAGAVNVDAAKRRAEDDHPLFEALDGCAA